MSVYRINRLLIYLCMANVFCLYSLLLAGTRIIISNCYYQVMVDSMVIGCELIDCMIYMKGVFSNLTIQERKEYGPVLVGLEDVQAALVLIFVILSGHFEYS